MVTALLEGDDADLLKHPPVFSQLYFFLLFLSSPSLFHSPLAGVRPPELSRSWTAAPALTGLVRWQTL